MRLYPGTRQRLTAREAFAFAGSSLFDRIGRTACEAGCLPRKELYESWEAARRIRRRFRGGSVVDIAAGHGLLGWVMLILDDTSPSALCVDKRTPASAARLDDVFVRAWPRLAGRVRHVEAPLGEVDLPRDALLACVHGCGGLTDEVLERAIAARCPVAVVPCCQDHRRGDLGGLGGWLDGDLAIDVTRAARLRQAGFEVWTQRLPEAVTARNRLLVGRPRAGG